MAYREGAVCEQNIWDSLGSVLNMREGGWGGGGAGVELGIERF